MISTRRGFLSTLTGVVAVPSWREDRSEPPAPRAAHDTTPSPATASAPPEGPQTTQPAPWLDAWQRLPRQPLLPDHFPQFGKHRAIDWFHASLITCRIREGRPFEFIYHGGSDPGSPRNVLPVLLFTTPSRPGDPDLSRDPAYLLAHCLKRNAVRTFRLDLISA